MATEPVAEMFSAVVAAVELGLALVEANLANLRLAELMSIEPIAEFVGSLTNQAPHLNYHLAAVPQTTAISDNLLPFAE